MTRIDIDFTKECPPDRKCGLLPETPAEMFGRMAAPKFSDRNDVIPESDWKELCHELETELRNGVREVKDQNGEGSCVANATTGAMQCRAYHQFGQKHFVPLSAMSLYKRIGTSAQSGAYISDGAKESENVGVLPLSGQDQYAHTHPAIGFRNSLPDGWKSTAKFFRAKWEKVESLAEFMSALLTFKPCLIGRSGHSIYYFLPKYEGNELRVGYANSWGQWNEKINDVVGKGLGWDSRRTAASLVGYACESVTVRTDIDLPGGQT